MNERTVKFERGIGWVYIAMPLVPFVFLSILTSNRFVRRHSQQGLALGIVFWALLFLNGVFDGSCLGMLAVVLLIWVGGAAWGRGQVKRGDCWLMHRRGEGNQLPRPWPVSGEQLAVSTTPQTTLSGSAAFRRGLVLLEQNRRTEAVQQLMVAYRGDNAAIRRLATSKLALIGEVEEF